jgi:hypothetical protein
MRWRISAGEVGRLHTGRSRDASQMATVDRVGADVPADLPLIAVYREAKSPWLEY